MEGKGQMSGAAATGRMGAETLSRIRLGEIPTRTKAITEEQLEMALERQRECGGKLGEILVQQGIVTPLSAIAQIVFNAILNTPDYGAANAIKRRILGKCRDWMVHISDPLVTYSLDGMETYCRYLMTCRAIGDYSRSIHPMSPGSQDMSRRNTRILLS